MKNKRIKLTDDVVPGNATHPGELINDEIKARNLKQKEIAQKMGVLPEFLNGLIQGKQHITPELAIKLESVFEISSEFWMGLQVQYEIDSIKIKYRDRLKKSRLPSVKRKSLSQAIA